MGKCLIVGVEDNTFTNKSTGELVRSSILHVVHDVSNERGLNGQRVESIKVFFDTSNIRPGKHYDLVWGCKRYGNKAYAQLEKVSPV